MIRWFMGLTDIFGEITRIHQLCNEWEIGQVADREFHNRFVQLDVNALMTEHFRGAFDDDFDEESEQVKEADAAMNSLDVALDRVRRIENEITRQQRKPGLGPG